MIPTRILAIVLIVAGAAGLVYGGFSYTRDSSAAQIGPIALTVKETRYAAVPVWAGVAAIAVGAALLLVPAKRA